MSSTLYTSNNRTTSDPENVKIYLKFKINESREFRNIRPWWQKCNSIFYEVPRAFPCYVKIFLFHYRPSKNNSDGELIFVGTGALALVYAAFCFLWIKYIPRTQNLQRSTTALKATGKVSQPWKSSPRRQMVLKMLRKSGWSSQPLD